jgi:uncharacterized membrane protein
MQMDWGLVVLLSCVTVPVLIVFGLYFWSGHDEGKTKSDGTRFLGTQMDIAILLLAILLLLALAAWVRKTLFG